MELIDLSDCALESNLVLKIKSLDAFLKENEFFDQAKLCKALEVEESVLIKWITESYLRNQKSTKEKILDIYTKDPTLSQRKIGKLLGVSHVCVNRHLKTIRDGLYK